MLDERIDPQFLRHAEEVAADITSRAGALLLERFDSALSVEFKDSKQTDPVTEIDRAVERLVADELQRAFPSHGLLGEEGVAGQSTSSLLWVVDPLDGTANYAGRLPLFGVSLALLHRGVPVVGCLFVPLGPRPGPGLLRASLGNGSRIGVEAISVDLSPFDPIRPVAAPPQLAAMFHVERGFARAVGQVRNLGSISQELAMVATGRFRYAVFGAPRAWDVAAGIILIREAGGEALVWERRAWRRFERFVPPPSRDGRETTLRDWARPMLVGGPRTLRHVAPRLAPRRPPPRLVRWALARRRALRSWLDARRGRLGHRPARP